MSSWVRALTVWNGSPVAGGTFIEAGGQTVNRIARWDDCPPTPDCPGDLTGDNNIGVDDLLALLAAWGPCADPANCPADLTGDGAIGVDDLLQLLAAWGQCP